MFSNPTTNDFYWKPEPDKYSKDIDTWHLHFKPNSMICAEVYVIKDIPLIWHSEIWVFKSGRAMLNAEDLDVIKLKTIIKAVEMIKQMDKELKETYLGNKLISSEEGKELLKLYNTIIPKKANEYFWGTGLK